MSDVIDALQIATESQLSEVNTMLPGTVVSYDAGRNRAVVRPTLPKALADGLPLDAPTVAEVPILWPASAGGAVFTMPIRPGDGVMLVFAQRSLEGWLGGNNGAPDDPRRFDLSDAVAIPGLRASGPGADPDAVVLALDGAILRLEPGGTARLTVTKLVVEGNVEVSGKIDCTGDVKAGLISLQLHKTSLVQPGAGVSGVPVP